MHHAGVYLFVHLTIIIIMLIEKNTNDQIWNVDMIYNLEIEEKKEKCNTK
jgi:hypothetical protein